MTKDLNRRTFLKTAFAALVSTAACPHVFLGEEIPRFKAGPDKSISGFYRVSFEKYPELNELWGSVRIGIDWPEEPGFPAIIVTRVPKDDYGKDFVCVSERCPHEGYPVGPLHPFMHNLECTGHFTLFSPDGVYQMGPASDNLEPYPCHFTEGDDSVYVEITGLVSATDAEQDVVYLKYAAPNPSIDAVSFDYGIEKSGNVMLEVFDMTGSKVVALKDSRTPAGHYSETIDVSSFSPGTYILQLTVDSRRTVRRKFIVAK